jgi:hypothetical protein
MMTTDIKLTDAQLRALRILAEHDWVRETTLSTCDDAPEPRIHFQTARVLRERWLAQSVHRDGFYGLTIRAKGRQVLREHDEAADRP